LTDASGGKVLRDLVFAELQGFRPLSLDLHLPNAILAPVVLFLHGGGWRRGSRRTFTPGLSDADSFGRITSAGFAVASADYRLSGEARFPAQLEDVLSAVGWLQKEGPRHGLDGNRIVLWGESAGAHLAALGGLSGAPGVRGVVDWYGPADLTTMGRQLNPDDPGEFDLDSGTREAELIGGWVGALPEAARAASPALQVREGAPPFHISHGTADSLVPFAQSAEFADALRSHGAEVELVPVDGASHFWSGVADTGPLFDRALEFARRVCERQVARVDTP
jgi:acetyl esterase/lipase